MIDNSVKSNDINIKKESFAKALYKYWSEISNTYSEGHESLEIVANSLKKIELSKCGLPDQSYILKELFNSLNEFDISYEASLSFNENFDKIKTLINWYPNNVYTHADEAIKRGNYCANLVGKERECQDNPFLFQSDDILVGLFLLGEGNLYPEHKHPAKEMWVILSGEAKWKRDGEDWRLRKPGEYFMHSYNQSHAMQTLDEPLLAMWAWTGDLEKWAEWSVNE